MSTSPPLIVADRYRLVAPLGQGGMGRVWRATDVVLHREVAIKELVPPPGLTPEERQEMRERSLREARAIARLNNINVVRVFDVLRTDADPWIVMEYVPSRSLHQVVTEQVAQFGDGHVQHDEARDVLAPGRPAGGVGEPLGHPPPCQQVGAAAGSGAQDRAEVVESAALPGCGPLGQRGGDHVGGEDHEVGGPVGGTGVGQPGQVLA